MLINMDPEVAAAFQASTAVSRTCYFLISLILLFMIVVKGCGVDMLKMGNARRRSKKEILDSKIKEAQEKALEEERKKNAAQTRLRRLQKDLARLSLRSSQQLSRALQSSPHLSRASRPLQKAPERIPMGPERKAPNRQYPDKEACRLRAVQTGKMAL